MEATGAAQVDRPRLEECLFHLNDQDGEKK